MKIILRYFWLTPYGPKLQIIKTRRDQRQNLKSRISTTCFHFSRSSTSNLPVHKWALFFPGDDDLVRNPSSVPLLGGPLLPVHPPPFGVPSPGDGYDHVGGRSTRAQDERRGQIPNDLLIDRGPFRYLQDNLEFLISGLRNFIDDQNRDSMDRSLSRLREEVLLHDHTKINQLSTALYIFQVRKNGTLELISN